MPEQLTDKPTNIIYTGVAGTGKTFQLLRIAEQYTDYLPHLDNENVLRQILDSMSWREVICFIFLERQDKQQDLIKVPEIVAHRFFTLKAAQNQRNKNLSNTAWSILQMHSAADSKTVSCDNRASQAYFDKDDSGAWYLLAHSKALLADLSQQLIELKQVEADNKARGQGLGRQRFSMVSFHQAYGYEEFVEGIRPVMQSSQTTNSRQTLHNQTHHSQTQMSYDIQDGAFLTLCQRAVQDPKQRYAMLIDEINRANVSRVFGELLSLIEPDKRAGMHNAMSVNLAYSGRNFSVPANVDIYATMNTQDHSLAPLDMAMRRRFRFIDCPPRPELLPVIAVSTNAKANLAKSITSHPLEDQYSDENDSETIDLAQLLAGINRRVIQTLGSEAQLGHAFLLEVTDLDSLQTVLIEQVIPQLAQAAGGQVAILQYIFCDEQQPQQQQFIQDSQASARHHTTDPVSNIKEFSTTQPRLAGSHEFLGVSMSAGGYQLNADLLARDGEFAKPHVYQRLY